MDLFIKPKSIYITPLKEKENFIKLQRNIKEKIKENKIERVKESVEHQKEDPKVHKSKTS